MHGIKLEKYFNYIVRHDTVCKNNYINVMQTPRIHRIILNIGVGNKAVIDRKQVIPALFALELVTEQRPNITRAKKSIDKFKLRRQMPIGAKVTLRNHKMYLFLDKWVKKNSRRGGLDPAGDSSSAGDLGSPPEHWRM